MIYVHGKGMIIDDEYVILGSANINQTSLAGTGDTEITMGAYQPRYTWSAKKRHPRGQIYGYRMSLWGEHLGMLGGTLEEPEILDCVRKVNEIADNNWKLYASEDFSPLQGHVIKYPLLVDHYRKVSFVPTRIRLDPNGKFSSYLDVSISQMLSVSYGIGGSLRNEDQPPFFYN